MLVGYHRSHEASVVVVDGAGRPLFAAAEERFVKRKLYKGYPERTLADIRDHFTTAGPVAPSDIRIPTSCRRGAAA